MWKYAMPVILGATLCVMPQLVAAEVTVNDVAFAVEVQDREPMGHLTPQASCENGQPAQTAETTQTTEMAQNGQNGQSPHSAIPVFDSSTGDRVYFWTKVQSSMSGLLHHTWYQNAEQGWTEAANVSLNIGESSSYRTWSSKTIDPSMHRGEWKVEVSTDEQPGNVLCTARFRVE